MRGPRAARRVGLRLGTGWEGGAGGRGGAQGCCAARAVRAAACSACGVWAHHKLDDALVLQTAASGESLQFCPASR
jgi:hypothetical protein